MDMQMEFQVTQVVYPRQDNSRNWLTALSIFFYLLLASSTVLRQGFVRSSHLLRFLVYWMITTELENWTQRNCHGKDRSAGVGTGSPSPSHTLLSVARGLLHKKRCQVQSSSSTWIIGTTYLSTISKNLSPSPKLLTFGQLRAFMQ